MFASPMMMKQAPAGGGSFDFADLFSGEAGGWWNAAVANRMWQDTGAATPADDDTEPVRRWDTLANSTDLLAPSDGERPLYRTAGGLHWLDFDAANDRINLSMSMASGTWTLAFSYTPTGSNAMALSISNSIWLLPAQSGSSSTSLSQSVSAINSVHFDNAAHTLTNRGALYTALQSANTCIIDWTPGAAWNGANRFGYYSGVFPEGPGDIHAIGLINRSLTAGERGDVHAQLAALAGV